MASSSPNRATGSVPNLGPRDRGAMVASSASSRTSGGIPFGDSEQSEASSRPSGCDRPMLEGSSDHVMCFFQREYGEVPSDGLVYDYRHQ